MSSEIIKRSFLTDTWRFIMLVLILASPAIIIVGMIVYLLVGIVSFGPSTGSGVNVKVIL